MKHLPWKDNAATTWSAAREPQEIKEAVRQRVIELLECGQSVRVLEAGCGSASHIKLGDSAYVVGVDISKEQLEKNAAVHEKILGDIQRYPLPKGRFDVAVCWMVLEHLSRPKDALRNLFQSLKSRGLLVVAIPNLISFKGIVTKLTPYWFHVLSYEFMKYESRPFPTYLRAAIVPKRIIRFAGENGFGVEFCKFIEGNAARKFRARYPLVQMGFSVANSIVQFLSLGNAEPLFLDNCYLIFRKGAAGSAESC